MSTLGILLTVSIALGASAALTVRQARRAFIARCALTRPGFTAWQVAGARDLSVRLMRDALLWAVLTAVEGLLAGFILGRVL